MNTTIKYIAKSAEQRTAIFTALMQLGYKLHPAYDGKTPQGIEETTPWSDWPGVEIRGWDQFLDVSNADAGGAEVSLDVLLAPRVAAPKAEEFNLGPWEVTVEEKNPIVKVGCQDVQIEDIRSVLTSLDELSPKAAEVAVKDRTFRCSSREQRMAILAGLLKLGYLWHGNQRLATPDQVEAAYGFGSYPAIRVDAMGISGCCHKSDCSLEELLGPLTKPENKQTECDRAVNGLVVRLICRADGTKAILTQDNYLDVDVVRSIVAAWDRLNKTAA